MNITAHETTLLRRGLVVVGLLGIAAVHILDLPGKWAETRYLAFGYIGIIMVAVVLAERVLRFARRTDLLASAVLAAAVMVGFFINRTVGMPGAMEDIGNWLEPLGLFSLLIEAMVVHQALMLARPEAAKASPEVELALTA